MFCLSVLQHVSATVMQIAALIMELKDMEFVMIANTTQLGITVRSANCPFTEMQLCLKMTQTLVLVSSLLWQSNLSEYTFCRASIHIYSLYTCVSYTHLKETFAVKASWS